jgi:hypothetical protein
MSRALLVFVVWLAALAPVGLSAATLYVSPTGSDTNPGTEAQPFQTIQKAANVVNPGDTVIVEDGTYTGFGSCATATVKPIVCLTRGGTAAAWVTFQARTPLGAKLDGQQNTNTDGIVFRNSVGYVKLEGFEIHGVGNAVASSSGIELYNGGHDVVISQVYVHDVGRLCTDTTNGEVGIYIQQHRVTVERSRIAAIGRFAPGEQGCTPATVYYKNHDHGIYVNRANDTRIVNTVFEAHTRGWAIQVYPGSVSGLAILHNTFTGANPYNSGQIIMAAGTTTSRIQNNIFSTPTTAGIYFYSGTHNGLAVGYNLSTHGLGTSTPGGVVFTANLTNTNPLLVSATDLHLSDGSPAIDSGLDLADVLTDADMVERVSSDRGAFEFVGPPPIPPDPCVVDPLIVVVSKWPTLQTGSRSGTWSSGSKALVQAAFLWTPLRFEAMDVRGCFTSVIR